jgi:hypothetical protein
MHSVPAYKYQIIDVTHEVTRNVAQQYSVVADRDRSSFLSTVGCNCSRHLAQPLSKFKCVMLETVRLETVRLETIEKTPHHRRIHEVSPRNRMNEYLTIHELDDQ